MHFGQRYAMECVVRGDTIACAINGAPLFTVTDGDDPIPHGGAGFAIADGALRADYFAIT